MACAHLKVMHGALLDSLNYVCRGFASMRTVALRGMPE